MEKRKEKDSQKKKRRRKRGGDRDKDGVKKGVIQRKKKGVDGVLVMG